jgi:hypothetical protein
MPALERASGGSCDGRHVTVLPLRLLLLLPILFWSTMLARIRVDVIRHEPYAASVADQLVDDPFEITVNGPLRFQVVDDIGKFST